MNLLHVVKLICVVSSFSFDTLSFSFFRKDISRGKVLKYKLMLTLTTALIIIINWIWFWFIYVLRDGIPFAELVIFE